jgi:DNA-binding PadR family transcriptional regulator
MSAMLEMAVLGLLKEQDMHGYELRKRLADVYGFPSAVSFGSLYPALSRLEDVGAVRVLDPAKGQSPPSAASLLAERRASRRRKVYSITALGAKLFEELLTGSQGSGEDDRSFNLRLAFARYLPPEGRLGLLERRRAVLGERMAQLAARARARRDDRYMRILVERQQEALSRDVSWLEHLITEERAGETLNGTATGARPAEVVTGASEHAGRLVPLVSASQLQRDARAHGTQFVAVDSTHPQRMEPK